MKYGKGYLISCTTLITTSPSYSLESLHHCFSLSLG